MAVLRRMPPMTLAAVFLCATMAEHAFAGEEVTKNGVVHVQNAAEPSERSETVHLEEAWRVGGEDSEDFFGMISQVVVGGDGAIYLLDTRLSEVPVYSPEGERLGTLSREGEGPGETRIPSNLLFMPDGTLGLVQIFPGKITKIQTDGTPAGVFEVGNSDPTQGGFMQFFDCVSRGDEVIISAESISQTQPGAQDRTNFVAAYDMEGNEKARFWETTRHLDFANFEFNEDERDRVDFRRMAVGTDGHFYLAPERNRYVINVYNAEGTLERIIEREYEHHRRSDEEIQRMRSALENQLRQLPDPKIEISQTEPDISGLRIGTDGNLWVDTSRGGVDQPEGIFFTWDVFTPDGHFLKQVSAACPGDGENDIMIWTPSGDAVQVTGFTEALRAFQGGGGTTDEEDTEEATPMEVVYYRVVEL